jgi:hypothetical protein
MAPRPPGGLPGKGQCALTPSTMVCHGCRTGQRRARMRRWRNTARGMPAEHHPRKD